MAMMFEYKPGMDLAQPWLFAVSRATTAYRFASDGTVKQAAANALRDSHYPFGLGSAIRTTLFEPTVINRCLQSQAWATAPWGNNVVTATNNNAAAPDLTATATKLLPNNTGANNNPYATQGSITITSTEFVAASCFVKANGYGAVVLRFSDAGSTVGIQAAFDLVAGGTGTLHAGFGGGVLTGFASIPLANGWYWVSIWGQVNGGVTAGQLFCYVYNTIANANAQTAYTADGVSSVLGWGAQLERNGTAAPKGASSYVPTTAGTATRNDESCQTPWPFQTQAMWCYTSWYDLGGSIWLQSAPIVTLSNSTPNTDPSWCPVFLRNNAKPGASWAGGCVTPQNGLLGSSRNTIAAGASLATVAPYDFVETFSRVLKDGSTWFDARINGGAVVTNGPVGPAGAIPFADIRNPTLYLGWPGALTGPQVGLTCVKIGADPTRITTLALAAAA